MLPATDTMFLLKDTLDPFARTTPRKKETADPVDADDKLPYPVMKNLLSVITSIDESESIRLELLLFELMLGGEDPQKARPLVRMEELRAAVPTSVVTLHVTLRNNMDELVAREKSAPTIAATSCTVEVALAAVSTTKAVDKGANGNTKGEPRVVEKVVSDTWIVVFGGNEPVIFNHDMLKAHAVINTESDDPPPPPAEPAADVLFAYPAIVSIAAE